MSKENISNADLGDASLLQIRISPTSSKQEEKYALASPFSKLNSNQQTPLQFRKQTGLIFNKNNQQPTTNSTSNQNEEHTASLQIRQDLQLPQYMSELFRNFTRQKLSFSPQTFLKMDITQQTPQRLSPAESSAEKNMDVEVSGLLTSTPKKAELFSICSTNDSLTSPIFEKSSGKKIENDPQSAKSSGSKITNLLENFIRPNEKHSSLIQKWKKGDPCFQGKYSTGATPKVTKEPILPQFSKSNLHITRANSDIPPTLMHNMPMFENKESTLSRNKFLNNIRKMKEKASGASKKSANVSPVGPGKGLRATKSPANLKETRPSKLLNQPTSPDFSAPAKQDQKTRLDRNLLTSPTGDAKNGLPAPRLLQKLFSIPENTNKSQMELDSNRINHSNLIPSSLFRKSNEDHQSFEMKPKVGSNSLFAEDFLGEANNGRFRSPRKSKKIFSNDEVIITTPNPKQHQHEGYTDIFTIGFGNFVKTSALRDKNPDGSCSRFEADFVKCEILGSGNFGSVYKCLNKIDGLEYAVKTIRQKKTAISHISQALNEVHALASLSLYENPFVVRYFYAWFEADFLHLVMEYCPSNLKNIERLDIKFSESMIRQVLRDVCQGLRHLHKQNIVHLDIKPENILFSRTSKYKIADLGLSRFAEISASEDIDEGDSRYLAPELLNDSTENLPDLTKADIFSLGVTIYELMIGQEMPKNGPEWHEIRNGILPKLDGLKNYSNSLKGIIKLMMSPNADKRPSAHELISNFLPSEIELELKWERTEKELLKRQLQETQEKIKRKRKNSF